MDDETRTERDAADDARALAVAVEELGYERPETYVELHRAHVAGRER